MITYEDTLKLRIKKRQKERDADQEKKIARLEEEQKICKEYRENYILPYAHLIDNQIRNHGIDKEDPCIVQMRIPNFEGLRVDLMKACFYEYIHIDLKFPPCINKQFLNSLPGNDGTWFIHPSYGERKWYDVFDSLKREVISYTFYASITLG